MTKKSKTQPRASKKSQASKPRPRVKPTLKVPGALTALDAPWLPAQAPEPPSHNGRALTDAELEDLKGKQPKLVPLPAAARPFTDAELDSFKVQPLAPVERPLQPQPTLRALTDAEIASLKVVLP